MKQVKDLREFGVQVGRLERCRVTSNHVIEVKNYNIATKSGRYRLYQDVPKQVFQRNANLPKGTAQTIVIDIRGQNVNQNLLNQTKNKLQTLTTSRVNVKWLKD